MQTLPLVGVPLCATITGATPRGCRSRFLLGRLDWYWEARLFRQGLVAFAVLCAFVWCDPSSVFAQGEEELGSFFKPQIEPTPTKKPSGPPPVFSFAAYEPSFKELCANMEADGRLDRLVGIAREEASKKGETCIACKALWRTVLAACEKRGPKATPTPKKISGTPTAVSEADGQAVVAEGAKVAQESESGTPVPATPTVPVPQRRPSTETLDSASRFSTFAYTHDPGEGGGTLALRVMVSRVMSSKDFSLAEREYYDTVFTYLMAAWEGREEEKPAVANHSEVNVDEFFDR